MVPCSNVCWSSHCCHIPLVSHSIQLCSNCRQRRKSQGTSPAACCSQSSSQRSGSTLAQTAAAAVTTPAAAVTTPAAAVTTLGTLLRMQVSCSNGHLHSQGRHRHIQASPPIRLGSSCHHRRRWGKIPAGCCRRTSSPRSGSALAEAVALMAAMAATREARSLAQEAAVVVVAVMAADSVPAVMVQARALCSSGCLHILSCRYHTRTVSQTSAICSNRHPHHRSQGMHPAAGCTNPSNLGQG